MMTEKEFANKIEWEGGIIGALEYGLKHTDLEDQVSMLAARWRYLDEKWAELQPAIKQVEAELPEEAW